MLFTVHADIVHADDVGMGKLRCVFRLLMKFADKLGIPHEKMPANIVENFGNASGVTVPTCISYNLGEQLVDGKMKLCMAGFGVGLTWSSIMMEMGNMNFNKIIEF